jgi:hypothetical protein
MKIVTKIYVGNFQQKRRWNKKIVKPFFAFLAWEDSREDIGLHGDHPVC